MADTNATPSTNLGPWLLAAGPFIAQIADASADVKRAAENVGLAWMLPYLGTYALVGSGLCWAVWQWRRSASRGAPWALWLAGVLPRMPWERG